MSNATASSSSPSNPASGRHWRQLLKDGSILGALRATGGAGVVPVALYRPTRSVDFELGWITGCRLWDALDAAVEGAPCRDHTHRLVARALVCGNRIATPGPLGCWTLTAWPLVADSPGAKPHGALVVLRPANKVPDIAALQSAIQQTHGVALPKGALKEAMVQLESATDVVSAVHAAMEGIATDIVDQITAERVVAERGGPLGEPWDIVQLRQIVCAMGSGLVVTDPKGLVSLCNPKAQAVLGCDLEGQPLSAGFEVPSGRDAVDTALTAALQQGPNNPGSPPPSVEVEVHTGDRRLLALVITPIRVGEVVTGLVVVVSDTTRARDLDALREEFLSSVNHELRTPLATLRGVATTLRDEPDMGVADRTDFLEILDREARRVSVLAEDMLAMTRLDARRAPLKTQPLDLRVHLTELVSSFGAECEAADVWLDVTMPEDPVWVDANPGLLSQLGHNLVGNALKFTPSGGRIAVRVAFDASAGELRWEVVDDSPPLTPEEQQTAFERFYNSSRAARVVAGSGLGLSLVKRIADAHGWTVALESPTTPGDDGGRGRRVTVRLPLTS